MQGTENLDALAVDDDSRDLGNVASLLHSSGYNVVSASDGYAAMELAQRRRFDLITVDCNMSIIPGHEVAALIKTYQLNVNTPIVMVSRSKWHEVYRTAYGIDFYVPKENAASELPLLLGKLKRL